MVLARTAGALLFSAHSEALLKAAGPRLQPGCRPRPAHHRRLRTKAAEDGAARSDDAPSITPAPQQQPEAPQQPSAAAARQPQVPQLEERLGHLSRQLTNLFPLWILLAAAASMYYPPAFTWFTPHITSGLALVMLGTGLTLTLQVGSLAALPLPAVPLPAACRGPAEARGTLQPCQEAWVHPPAWPLSWPAHLAPAGHGQRVHKDAAAAAPGHGAAVSCAARAAPTCPTRRPDPPGKARDAGPVVDRAGRMLGWAHRSQALPAGAAAAA
jgi:hypothetical protein